MNSKLYDFLNKFQRWLPSLGTFYLALCMIWGLPFGDPINQTITAVATLLAVTLEISTGKWKETNQITITKIAEDLEG